MTVKLFDISFTSQQTIVVRNQRDMYGKYSKPFEREGYFGNLILP